MTTFTGETHRLLIQIAQSQARTEAEVKALVERHDRRDAEDLRRQDAVAKLETRTRKLEYGSHRRAGAAGAGGAMFGTLATILVTYFTGHIPPILHK